MVTGTPPKPDPGGGVENPGTGTEARVPGGLHRRGQACGSGIGEFRHHACSPSERDTQRGPLGIALTRRICSAGTAEFVVVDT